MRLRPSRLRRFATNRWLLWTKPDSTWGMDADAARWGTNPLEAALPAWEMARRLAIFSLLLLEYGDFPMIRKVLKGIKLPRRTDEWGRSADPREATVSVLSRRRPSKRRLLFNSLQHI